MKAYLTICHANNLKIGVIIIQFVSSIIILLLLQVVTEVNADKTNTYLVYCILGLIISITRLKVSEGK